MPKCSLENNVMSFSFDECPTLVGLLTPEDELQDVTNGPRMHQRTSPGRGQV